MKKKFFLVCFFLFLILLTILFFFSYKINKNTINNQKYLNINYSIENIDEDYIRIKLDEEIIKIQKNYYNKFAKDNFTTSSLLVETSTNCKRSTIFLNSIYNFPQYSNVYKLSTISENLYINIHNSKNNLNFLYFLIHKNQIKCIKDLYLVEGKKLPYEHFIIKKDKKIKNISKKFYEPFALKNVSLIGKDEDALINNNNIIHHKRYSTINSDSPPSTMNTVYYKYSKKTYYLNRDVYLGKLNTQKINNYFIKCKILNGKVNLLFYDSDNLEIINFESCYQNKSFYISLPKDKKINFLINAKIDQFNTLESKFKIEFFKQSN